MEEKKTHETKNKINCANRVEKKHYDKNSNHILPFPSRCCCCFIFSVPFHNSMLPLRFLFSYVTLLSGCFLRQFFFSFLIRKIGSNIIYSIVTAIPKKIESKKKHIKIEKKKMFWNANSGVQLSKATVCKMTNIEYTRICWRNNYMPWGQICYWMRGMMVKSRPIQGLCLLITY